MQGVQKDLEWEGEHVSPGHTGYKLQPVKSVVLQDKFWVNFIIIY